VQQGHFDKILFEQTLGANTHAHKLVCTAGQKISEHDRFSNEAQEGILAGDYMCTTFECGRSREIFNKGQEFSIIV